MHGNGGDESRLRIGLGDIRGHVVITKRDTEAELAICELGIISVLAVGE